MITFRTVLMPRQRGIASVLVSKMLASLSVTVSEHTVEITPDERESKPAEVAKRHLELDLIEQQTTLRVRLESVSVNPTTKWGLLGGVGEAKGRVNLRDSRVPLQSERPQTKTQDMKRAVFERHGPNDLQLAARGRQALNRPGRSMKLPHPFGQNWKHRLVSNDHARFYVDSEKQIARKIQAPGNSPTR